MRERSFIDWKDEDEHKIIRFYGLESIPMRDRAINMHAPNWTALRLPILVKAMV